MIAAADVQVVRADDYRGVGTIEPVEGAAEAKHEFAVLDFVQLPFGFFDFSDVLEISLDQLEEITGDVVVHLGEDFSDFFQDRGRFRRRIKRGKIKFPFGIFAMDMSASSSV